ncbi:PEP-CTERM sorting domain-containing protein [Planktothrix serta]|nr:PEP-CTERM sorting domain-containing protein [Planktothrix serta]
MKSFIVATPVIALLSSISPSFAGTLATAEAETLIYNFSQVPTSISTFTDTQTLALAFPGTVFAEANANAYFDVNFCLEPDYCFPLANNSSQAITVGEGQEYLGWAQSQAAAIGYQFEIAENQEFSFDFLSILSLGTQKSLQQESTQAANYIAFYLFEDSTDTLLDFFSLNSSLNSANNYDLSIEKSNGFELSLLETTNAEENQASVNILLSGLYSRQLSEGQNLTLIAYQTSSTIVKAPEPSTSIGLLIMGALGIALGWKKKSNLSD